MELCLIIKEHAEHIGHERADLHISWHRQRLFFPVASIQQILFNYHNACKGSNLILKSNCVELYSWLLCHHTIQTHDSICSIAGVFHLSPNGGDDCVSQKSHQMNLDWPWESYGEIEKHGTIQKETAQYSNRSNYA